MAIAGSLTVGGNFVLVLGEATVVMSKNICGVNNIVKLRQTKYNMSQVENSR